MYTSLGDIDVGDGCCPMTNITVTNSVLYKLYSITRTVQPSALMLVPL